MAKRDWRRAHFHGRRTDSKYGAGVILPNGTVTPSMPMDNLARRAERAKRHWKKELTRRGVRVRGL
jgi:hypothetical protein